jgi:peptidoglycan hydrolase-like protein with peptidoglycan-binding domain
MKHFDDDMDKFRARVAALLGESVEPEVIPEAAPAPSAPATSGGDKTVKIEMSVLKKGSKGEQVKTLQRLLTALGYPCGVVDGSFGNNTLAGVMAFQRGNKLTVDGYVGQATWTALLK